MAKKEVVRVERILDSLLKRKGIFTKKIVAFGSYAKNKQNEDSDIDLIVVSKDMRNKDIFERVELTGGIHRDLIRRIDKPVDIIYCSDTEWDKGDTLIIREAKENGIVYSY